MVESLVERPDCVSLWALPIALPLPTCNDELGSEPIKLTFKIVRIWRLPGRVNQCDGDNFSVLKKIFTEN